MEVNLSSNSTATYNFENWPNSLAAALMFMNSFIGLPLNSSIICNFVVCKKQRTAFNMICAIRAANNVYVLLVVMIGVYVPESLIGFSIYPRSVESIIIIFGMNLLVYNEFQSVYLSINRFFAMLFPLRFNWLLSIKFTLLLHILCYGNRFWNVITEHLDRIENSNHISFSAEHLAYGGTLAAPDYFFEWSVLSIIFPLFINAVTYIRFYYLKKRTSRESQHRRKARENVAQFFQTVFQDSLFFISSTFGLKLNTIIAHRFWTFFCFTFVWQFIHVLDGFIMMMFNARLSPMKRRLKINIIETITKFDTRKVLPTRTWSPPTPIS
ncbi:7TM GPCR serpentine receptor class x (Srx) domain-containing protein [Caenorhabditis elegans]|uniref:7TM GPCR serpentine receptor class x (Srx) domain-containing protein n=1 Tax=Caenorhabditis elegans TaxID=6239 RepID=Q93163_CAEEL|nr:7TM GPCR serpentine receptor class x (Srx) domain-containing protein [Caenorhabditis elegans]CAB02705.3 7TM GPCR serpentine receptor class x (Srx) domain-containing protein [Caenorhabditis elegans]|eukprot:NP_506720.3 Serpentine Receptor, class X [Caenorhabditis elegans]